MVGTMICHCWPEQVFPDDVIRHLDSEEESDYETDSEDEIDKAFDNDDDESTDD